MKKSVLLVALCALAACSTAPAPNSVTFETDMVDGKMVMSGRAGADITEEDVRNIMVGPACRDAGKAIETVEMVPQDDGTKDLTVVCS